MRLLCKGAACSAGVFPLRSCLVDGAAKNIRHKINPSMTIQTVINLGHSGTEDAVCFNESQICVLVAERCFGEGWHRMVMTSVVVDNKDFENRRVCGDINRAERMTGIISNFALHLHPVHNVSVRYKEISRSRFRTKEKSYGRSFFSFPYADE